MVKIPYSARLKTGIRGETKQEDVSIIKFTKLKDNYCHGGGVNWVVFHKMSLRKSLFVLHQVEQRVTHVLLVDLNDGVSHGKNLHHVRGDPGVHIITVN